MRPCLGVVALAALLSACAVGGDGGSRSSGDADSKDGTAVTTTSSTVVDTAGHRTDGSSTSESPSRC